MKQQFAAQTFIHGLASAEKESTNKRSSTASLQDPDPVERTCDCGRGRSRRRDAGEYGG